VVAFLFFVTTYHPTGDWVVYTRSRGAIWLLLIPIALLAGIVGSFWLFMLFIQVVAHNCEAIWIQEGKLVYLNKWFMMVRLADVEGVSLGTFGSFGQRAIIVALHDGPRKIIPTGALSSPAEAVLLRLTDVITSRNFA